MKTRDQYDFEVKSAIAEQIGQISENTPDDTAVMHANLSFSAAWLFAKAGARIRLSFWRPGTWITVAEGSQAGLAADKFWNRHSKAFAESNGGAAIVQPYILFCDGERINMGYSIDQAELLSDHWEVLGDEIVEPERVDRRPGTPGMQEHQLRDDRRTSFSKPEKLTTLPAPMDAGLTSVDCFNFQGAIARMSNGDWVKREGHNLAITIGRAPDGIRKILGPERLPCVLRQEDYTASDWSVVPAPPDPIATH